ncbi:hypothetical protein BH24ACT10_BH24ACT10_17780 [soil metagenome]
MSRHPHRLVTALAVGAVAVSLSGCGAGLDAQTYQERNNAGSTDTAVGSLAVRNVFIEAPSRGDVYEQGDDATATITVTNVSPEPDRLVEVTTDAAEEVVVLVDGEEDEVVVPPLGSTGSLVTLELLGLTRELRTGEFVTVTLRFAENGNSEFIVQVALTGENDREIYTGEYEEGGEEPALQAPAGGHGEGEESAE